MSFYISICEDMVAFRATGLIDEDSPFRGMIEGRSGNFIHYNSDETKAMIIITTLDGLDDIAALSYITLTTPEELFGFRTEVMDVEGTATVVTPAPYVLTHDNWVDTGAVENRQPIYENIPYIETITPETYTIVAGTVITPEPYNIQVDNWVETGEVDVVGHPILQNHPYSRTITPAPYTTSEDEIVTPEPYQVRVDNFVDTGVLDSGFPVYENQPTFETITPESYTVIVPVYEETAGDPVLRALYDSIYDQSPVVDTETGTTSTPPKLFAVAGNFDGSHLL